MLVLLCVALLAFAFDRHPTAEAEVARLWRTQEADAPLCRLADNATNCAVPTARDVARVSCSSSSVEETDTLDLGLAAAIAQIAARCTVLELDAGHACYSYYWTSALAAFAAFRAVRTARIQRKSLVSFIEQGNEAKLAPADTVISLRLDCRDRGCAPIASRAQRLLIVAPRDATRLRALTGALAALDFTMHNAMTARLRTAADSGAFRESVCVFTRRQLVARPTDTAFLRSETLTTSTIQWNDAVTFAGVRYRVYVPAIDWSAYRGVIGVLSTARAGAMRDAIRGSWARVARASGYAVLFLLAEARCDEQHESMRHSDVVVFDARDVYTPANSTLPLKTHGFVQIVAKRAHTEASTIEWIVKCDDDTLVFADRLAALLAALQRPTTTSYYVGCAFQRSAPFRDPSSKFHVPADLYPASFYPPFMSGGAGYALSMPLARCVAAHTASAEHVYFPREDVSVRLAIEAAACDSVVFVDRSDVFRPGVPRSASNATVTQHRVDGVVEMAELWRKHGPRTTTN